ncbi:MAG: hypothetical protein RLZ71_480 [Actinomycetota bacterium]|jgi:CrcB protein
MNEFLAVALFGGAGAVARFALSGWARKLPWGILTANTAAAILASISVTISGAYSSTSIALVVGLAGGLSTYSAVVGHVAGFWRDRQWTRGWWNLFLNLFVPSTAALIVSIIATALLK